MDVKMKQGKKQWFLNLVRDLSPTSSGTSRPFVASVSNLKSGHMDQATLLKWTGLVFAIIGALATLRWLVTVLILLDTSLLHSQPVTSTQNPTPEVEHRPHENEAPGECEASPILTDLIERLQLLEVAFKEQVFAREMIAREINNQTDVYGILDRKLATFFERLDNISMEFSSLETKYAELSDRVTSDEILGLIVVVVLAVQFTCWCRPKLQDLVEKATVYPEIRTLLDRAKLKLERKPSSTPSTPKKLRNEICIIIFQRESADSVFTNLSDAMLRHLEGVKMASRPFHTVASLEDIKGIPQVRLYVIIVDLETRRTFINGSEKDLVITTIKATKSTGGHTVVVLTNDEGSKCLTAHSTYNSSIRMVKSNDCVQELAANGKLFSMWQEMTSHQLSHLRRIIKSVLNVKSVLR